jgi:predicted transcriptional regulator
MTYQDTSRAAWRSFVPVSAVLDRLIMEALTNAGDGGLTDLQIEETIGRKHQAVSANRRHLVERGLVVDSGRRRLLPTNRNAIVWIIKELSDTRECL